ncbi:MAG: flagellar type III secretion system pore protein FliP [Planctomycetota bacterium]
MKRFLLPALVLGATLALGPELAAQANDLPSLEPAAESALASAASGELSSPVQIVLILTALALAPAILMTVTCFTRIIIVLSFVRKALSIQDMPPNQVVIGLSIFLTIVAMNPTINAVWEGAVQPYMNEELSMAEATDVAKAELKTFLLSHAHEEEIALFLDVTQAEDPETPQDVPLQILIPAFALSEVKTAFKMGFLIYIPFLILDIVISSILLAMGMFMLPPVIISTPFKILLFILVDGWTLVIGSLMQSFQVVAV